MSARPVLEELIQRDGSLTPHSVLEEAIPEESPLHHYFEWDDTEAAHRHRLDQARSLIQRYRFAVEVEPERFVQIRSFTNVPTREGQYLPTDAALGAPATRDLVFRQAMRDVAALRAKYQALVDFDHVLQEALNQRRQRRKKAS